ncbi:carbon-nitrogen hydrolase family protein [Cupriavidus sp. 2SB]|uniref:carbon-nitrogen hydrolase family protein n=1 Tax=Cupriavidus sp. 2SB TaxID=2502199 RepID=UPI0010F65670|nr:carbon-nitrogen hydrolase family protein [Cupriavidus sp. 2SB]
MTVSRVAFVEWPEGLLPDGAAWETIRRTVALSHADILVTNEMPFGPWLAESQSFDKDAARRSVDLHHEALSALSRLEVGAVISSRPIFVGERLTNEAFVVEGGVVRPIHRKQYFPQEEGWYEEAWFARDRDRFECIQVGQLRVGVLLCTELFFNENARHYGRQGADLIVVPRASGKGVEAWQTATMMAAIVSGAYVVSSNRAGHTPGGLMFGGTGLASTPDGLLISRTSSTDSLVVIDVDLEWSSTQKAAYPCYVNE